MHQCKFTRPYPNFLILDMQGTPSFPPVHFLLAVRILKDQTVPHSSAILLLVSNPDLDDASKNPRGPSDQERMRDASRRYTDAVIRPLVRLNDFLDVKAGTAKQPPGSPCNKRSLVRSPRVWLARRGR